MSQTLGIAHFAIKWPIKEGENVYNAGVNTIPIPFIGHLLGLVVGSVWATILLLFVGRVRGVVNYARATLGR